MVIIGGLCLAKARFVDLLELGDVLLALLAFDLLLFLLLFGLGCAGTKQTHGIFDNGDERVRRSGVLGEKGVTICRTGPADFSSSLTAPDVGPDSRPSEASTGLERVIVIPVPS